MNAPPPTDSAAWLASDGWREHPHKFRAGERLFDKQFDSYKIAVGITVWRITDQESFNLEIAGELADGTWIKLLNYSLPADIRAVVKLIPRMLATWEAMNSASTK